MLRPIVTAEAAKVTTSELDALDALLDEMGEGGLTEFVTHMSETLRQGNDVILFEQAI